MAQIVSRLPKMPMEPFRTNHAAVATLRGTKSVATFKFLIRLEGNSGQTLSCWRVARQAVGTHEVEIGDE